MIKFNNLSLFKSQFNSEEQKYYNFKRELQIKKF